MAEEESGEPQEGDEDGEVLGAVGSAGTGVETGRDDAIKDIKAAPAHLVLFRLLGAVLVNVHCGFSLAHVTVRHQSRVTDAEVQLTEL